jgi:hypothetical protein
MVTEMSRIQATVIRFLRIVKAYVIRDKLRNADI